MKKFVVLMIAVMFMSCSLSEEIEQGHRGRVFGSSGAWTLWMGGDGLNGNILNPGTHFVGLYDTIRQVDCTEKTVKESMQSPTKDNVFYTLDTYIRFSADCSDKAVENTLATVYPEKGRVVSAEQLYAMYIRPTLGEAVRTVVSPIPTSDINMNREKLLADIQKTFLDMMQKKDTKATKIHEVNLSNLIPPQEVTDVNTHKALQYILRDASIAEREKINAQKETADVMRSLKQSEGEAEAVKIREIGKAISENPLYLQYDLQLRLQEIYKEAGAQGNMVITAPNPNILINGK